MKILPGIALESLVLVYLLIFRPTVDLSQRKHSGIPFLSPLGWYVMVIIAYRHMDAGPYCDIISIHVTTLNMLLYEACSAATLVSLLSTMTELYLYTLYASHQPWSGSSVVRMVDYRSECQVFQPHHCQDGTPESLSKGLYPSTAQLYKIIRCR